MYKAILLPTAKTDLKEAAAWYNSKQKGLAKRFTKEVRKKVLFIRQNPRSTAIRYDNVRTAVLDVFPFMIHYVVDDAAKRVIISAVFHTSQNPEKWERK